MKAEPIAFIVAELIGAFIGTIIFVSIAQATKPPLGKR